MLMSMRPSVAWQYQFYMYLKGNWKNRGHIQTLVSIVCPENTQNLSYAGSTALLFSQQKASVTMLYIIMSLIVCQHFVIKCTIQKVLFYYIPQLEYVIQLAVFYYTSIKHGINCIACNSSNRQRSNRPYHLRNIDCKQRSISQKICCLYPQHYF